MDETLWAANDHLDSVRQLIASDAPHTVKEHREFDSFGNLLASYDEAGTPSTSTAALDSAFGFAGREWDEDAGLYYNRARYYDPATGRFLSEDPAVSDINLYRYAGNDGVNYRDPSGLMQAGHPLDDWSFLDQYGHNLLSSPLDKSLWSEYRFPELIDWGSKYWNPWDKNYPGDIFTPAIVDYYHNLTFPEFTLEHSPSNLDYQLKFGFPFVEYYIDGMPADEFVLNAELQKISAIVESRGLIASSSTASVAAPAEKSFGQAFFDGAVYGEFSEGNGWAGFAGQMVVGVTPAGVAADIRDISASVIALGNGGWRKPGNWLNLGLNTVGIIPLLGDGVKHGGKALRESLQGGAKEVAQKEIASSLTNSAGSVIGQGRHADLPMDLRGAGLVYGSAKQEYLQNLLKTRYGTTVKFDDSASFGRIDEMTGTMYLNPSTATFDVLAHEISHVRFSQAMGKWGTGLRLTNFEVNLMEAIGYHGTYRKARALGLPHLDALSNSSIGASFAQSANQAISMGSPAVRASLDRAIQFYGKEYVEEALRFHGLGLAPQKTVPGF